MQRTNGKTTTTSTRLEWEQTGSIHGTFSTPTKETVAPDPQKMSDSNTGAVKVEALPNPSASDPPAAAPAQSAWQLDEDGETFVPSPYSIVSGGSSGSHDASPLRGEAPSAASFHGAKPLTTQGGAQPPLHQLHFFNTVSFNLSLSYCCFRSARCSLF